MNNETMINGKLINEFIDKDNLKNIFMINQRLKINNFLNNSYAEILFMYLNNFKEWNLATGVDKNKYEKKNIPQFNNTNSLQIKNVNNAFSNDHFSYIFNRHMNGLNMSFHEYSLRQILSSEKFINNLNEITGLNLKKLTTLFASKYKSGNFLSPHSDKGNGRLAFVINLTKNWKPQYGGNLHFMNDNRTEIIDTFVPGFNNLILFFVPPENGIPHYVSHVVNGVKYNRYAISGWFD
jgi:Rps23 Pro-64 3,4-dihydroxylase Tpa1-like proline 4-hydroxylase